MIGQALGPYVLEAELGRGGMGVVYRARDQRLGRPVAIKLLPEHLGRDAGARERFQREARAISAFSHPGICTLYDVGETAGGQPYLVMELLEGETLQQRLRRGALAPAEARTIAVQVADALEAAHRSGMIHRDLKPANIFLTAGGQAKLLDFGLAKMVDAAAAAGPVRDDAPTLATPGYSDLTQPGLAVGTIAYMSPEQALGKPLDARSDIFSLGLVLYEMLTGQVAFPGTTSAAVFDGILNRTPPPLQERVYGCPADLAQAVGMALEKDPARRFASAAALRNSLRAGLSTASGSAPPPPAASGRRGRVWALVAVAVVIVGGGAYWWRSRTVDAPLMHAQDSVVLADFQSSAGDAMLDGALRQGLEVQLEQSPFLRVVSDQQMAAEEQLMGLQPGTPVEGAVATQICQRTGSAAALEGTVAQVGSEYSLTLQAVNCASGDALASVAETAADKNHVLDALGRLASGMRAKLGESLASMSQFDTPIEQVTTPSLPALETYSKGRQQLLAGNYATARDLFSQALALDPNFAMAYASRGTAEGNLNQRDDADFTQAYDRRNHVSQHERLYITAHYDQAGGDLPRAESDYRAWAATYPGDAAPRTDLCVLESRLGQIQAALADCAAANRLTPTAVTITDLAGMEMLAGRAAAARKLAAGALAKQPGNVALRELDYQIAVQSGGAAAAAGERRWLEAQPGAAAFLQKMQWLQNLRAGRLGTVRASLAAAGPDPGDRLMLAEFEAVLGARAAARRDADTALRAAHDDQTLAGAALALAMSGADTRAGALDTALEQRAHADTVVQQIELPVNRAWVALARRQPQAALRLLAPALPYASGQAANFLPAYTQGVVLLALHHWASAAAAFAQVIAAPGFTGLGAASRVLRARALEQMGKTAAARASYAAALAMWTQADSDLPLVRAARREAATLNTGR